jgi:hypothetical protein
MHEFYGSCTKPEGAMGKAKHMGKWVGPEIFVYEIGGRGRKRDLDIGIGSQSCREV